MNLTIWLSSRPRLIWLDPRARPRQCVACGATLGRLPLHIQYQLKADSRTLLTRPASISTKLQGTSNWTIKFSYILPYNFARRRVLNYSFLHNMVDWIHHGRRYNVKRFLKWTTKTHGTHQAHEHHCTGRGCNWWCAERGCHPQALTAHLYTASQTGEPDGGNACL